MLLDGIFLNSVGTFLPPRVPFETIKPHLKDEAKETQVDIESVCVSDKSSYVMGGLAAKQALERSTHRNETLSPIVYAEPVCLEHLTPVCYIQRILKQEDSLAFDLDAASDSGLTGIDVVARLLSSGTCANAGLVCAASRILLVDRYQNGAVLGDGAAAVILSKKEGFARLISSNRTSFTDFEFLMRNKGSLEKFEFKHGLDEVGYGPYVGTLSRIVQAAIAATLADAKISVDDISHFCPPAVYRLSLEETFLGSSGIPFEKTCWSELRKNGHVGACDQMLGLAYLIDTGQLRSGQFVMLIGGGAGWRFTCLLIQVV
ncbi:3-oxoacyl-[acyl-carrier-protein] synthase III C-terminal domain-containing protein [Mycobacterium decipiens]|uniref:Beta-ketoacyl-[acyl-carrier-protein] synthase III C-terminal domain-containing protein n=1 Tax=Mycobacterium decipiens TaxID=1430326 RepID=A0A1X2LR76_9MYCO|nr:3-oxoacyl-[acyl-carrier-protein] synthase III C-terminal domain-containing protein [Mycobacterium decipiens]OSC39018.1 hypothetical protein B8W66_18680 [Mycobacterium decipiens]